MQIINANLRKTALQRVGFLLFQKFKPFKRLALRKQWPMLQHLLQFSSGFHGRLFFWVDGEIDEAFPNVTHGLLGGMHHVFLVETVVAQFVHKDFVGGEIMGVFKLLAHLVIGK